MVLVEGLNINLELARYLAIITISRRICTNHWVFIEKYFINWFLLDVFNQFIMFV